MEQRFEVYDQRTGLTVGTSYATRQRARCRVDALDAKYGGYRYGVRPVGQTNQPATPRAESFLDAMAA